MRLANLTSRHRVGGLLLRKDAAHFTLNLICCCADAVADLHAALDAALRSTARAGTVADTSSTAMWPTMDGTLPCTSHFVFACLAFLGHHHVVASVTLSYVRCSGRGTSKGGAGGRNWGSTHDVARQGTESEAAATPEGGAEVDATAAAVEAKEEQPASPPAEPEEVDTSITLAQYEAQRSAKREGALFSTVAVDNSALLKQFEKAKRHDRDANDEFSDLFGAKHGKKATESAEDNEEAQTGPKAFDSAFLGFRVGTDRPPREREDRGERSERGRGGFGGRGGGRGRGDGSRGGARGRGGDRGRGSGGERGGRGAFRGGYSGPKVNVSDASAFPALGSA
jgi:hypothetical protein